MHAYACLASGSMHRGSSRGLALGGHEHAGGLGERREGAKTRFILIGGIDLSWFQNFKSIFIPNVNFVFESVGVIVLIRVI